MYTFKYVVSSEDHLNTQMIDVHILYDKYGVGRFN